MRFPIDGLEIFKKPGFEASSNRKFPNLIP